MTYEEFLTGKIDIAEESGFDVDPSEINPVLKPHQRDAVIWAVKAGRFGIGIELNSDYFRDGVGYLQAADMTQGTPTLFDFLDETGE